MIQDIQDKFNQVLTFSQGESNPQTDQLFKDWYEAKKDFIKKFGGLIYEVPETVSFRLGNRERKSRVDHFITTVASVYNNEPLACFLIQNIDGFYENKTVSDYLAPDGETVIKAGTKIIKAFKYFETSTTALAHLQTDASMLLQEDKVEGTLCFSVHPLDFLSSSENNYNWRSCHALDGEYRSGNLSYMCDSTTIICYLKGDKEEKLPRFPESVPWNSKKWRMLISYDSHNGVMFAGRQYPFFSEGALELITPFLFRALKHDNIFWSEWHNDFIDNWAFKSGKDHVSTYKYFPIGEKLFAAQELIQNAQAPNGTVLHFNDLLSSSYYTPFYCWHKIMFRSLKDRTPFIVGSSPCCIHCGEGKIGYTDSMFCEKCELDYGTSEDDQFSRCDCCGSRFYSEDGASTFDGAFVCPTCARDYCVPCANCDRLVFKEDAHYLDRIDDFICDECWKDMED